MVWAPPIKNPGYAYGWNAVRAFVDLSVVMVVVLLATFRGLGAPRPYSRATPQMSVPEVTDYREKQTPQRGGAVPCPRMFVDLKRRDKLSEEKEIFILPIQNLHKNKQKRKQRSALKQTRLK